MFDVVINPVTLGGLYMVSMGKAFLRFKNPRRRALDRDRVAFYERAWREAADKLGAKCTPLGMGILEIQLGQARTRVMESTSGIDDPATLAVLLDKPLTHRLLASEGLPVPRYREFSLRNMAPAIRFLEEAGGDCVVKPANGTGGGRGVTTGVQTKAHLARAAAAAAVYTEDLMIEQQVPGDNYRLLYLDGVLVDSFIRRPPTVVGDGRSTVRRLVRQANEERLRSRAGVSQILLSIDYEMRRTLAKQGLSLRSVPAEGQLVVLKNVVNDNRGDDNTTATALLCPSIIEDCARAVRKLDIRLAGIDIITRDPTVPLTEAGGVILEVNAPPNYYYHYHKKDGEFRLADHVLERVLLRGGRLNNDRMIPDGSEGALT